MGLAGLTPDMLALLKRRVYDLAAVTDKTVKVKYNSELVPVKNFLQYVDLYIGSKAVTDRIHEEANERWEYVVCLAPKEEFTQVSFVNGIYTGKGGKHVDYLTNQFGRLRDICIGANKEIYLATNGASWSNTNPNTHSIIVIHPPSELGTTEHLMTGISVFPNPIEQDFTINFPEDVLGNQFSLTDLTGRNIYSALITKQTTSINSADLNKGIYLLTVTMKNGSRYTKKLIK